MPLAFRAVQTGEGEASLTLDFELAGGMIVGLTGDPVAVRTLVELAAGTRAAATGAVEHESFDWAVASFDSADAERIAESVEAALASTARTIALGPGLALTSPVCQARAMRDAARLAQEGRLILLASQSLETLERRCDELLVLEAGRVVERGDPSEVVAKLREQAASRLRESSGPGMINRSARRGDGRAELAKLELLGEGGDATSTLRSGESAAVEVELRFQEDVADPVVGILIRNRVGVTVYGTNTELEQIRFGPCAPGDVFRLRFAFCCDLCPHEYTLTAASHDPDGTAHDWLDDALLFTVTDTRSTAGVANLRAKVSVNKA